MLVSDANLLLQSLLLVVQLAEPVFHHLSLQHLLLELQLLRKLATRVKACDLGLLWTANLGHVQVSKAEVVRDEGLR